MTATTWPAPRRRRRWGWLFAVLLLLLPWLFAAQMPSAVQLREEDIAGDYGFLPVPAPQAAPVPASAPVPLQYWPVPVPQIQSWIEEHYPGALAGLPAYQSVVQAALDAAKKYNLNPLVLLGELAAEQSFLSPNVQGGLAHAEVFAQNPWDYGVWPGSPFRFAIGPEASAMGAAALTARVAEAVLKAGWSWSVFEADLARVYVGSPSPDWARNTFGTWAAMAADSAITGGVLAQAIQDPSVLPQAVGQALQAAEKALGAPELGQLVAWVRGEVQQGSRWIARHVRAFLVALGVSAATAAAVASAIEAAGDIAALIAPALAAG